jgi:hypothetical protein
MKNVSTVLQDMMTLIASRTSWENSLDRLTGMEKIGELTGNVKQMQEIRLNEDLLLKI